MDKETEAKYIRAGFIAAKALEFGVKLVKPGVRVLDIVEKTEGFIKKQKADVAFPMNVSINDVAAHFTPYKDDDTKIADGDVVKLDVGVHIDGFIGDTATTVCLNKKYDKMCAANKKALEKAIELCKPGANTLDLAKAIETEITKAGYKPIVNLTGHGLEEYNLHGDPHIPNTVEGNVGAVLKDGDVIAIEPFATDGSGRVKESDTILIYMMIQRGSVRSPSARQIINFADPRNGLPFAERWLPLKTRVQARLGLKELESRNIIYGYPVLKEGQGGIISQFEHTVIVKDKPFVTTQLNLKKGEKK
ncbi:type II methionyl aminopeptidase [archaeon]|nr:type II methionyl aminopeptidase [archaeon]